MPTINEEKPEKAKIGKRDSFISAIDDLGGRIAPKLANQEIDENL